MRSRDSRRVRLERGCRVVALAAIGLLFVVIARGGPGQSLRVDRTEAIVSALARATTAPVAQLALRLTELPDESVRAWLEALRDAGTAVHWAPVDSLPTTALSSEPVPGPDHARRITLSGAPAGVVVIGDDLGIIDSAVVGAGTPRTVEARVSGNVVARTRGATLTAPSSDSARTRAVLVMGRAGWEARFTTAALEESGWPVESEFIITPRGATGPAAGTGIAVRTRGATAPLDTARYAAVVAVDASAARHATAIAAFVRDGGGLILLPDADVGALRALAPARTGNTFRGTLGGILSATPREGLRGRTLVSPTDDAVILERRGSVVTVAARRYEMGRVLMLAYEDLWRWRMEGGETAPDEHRAWWSALVSSVAFSPLEAVPDRRGNPAPFAAWIASLDGPQTDAADGVRRLPWTLLLLTLCILALMTEWTSRRLRGAR
jgi:hypothetical protein